VVLVVLPVLVVLLVLLVLHGVIGVKMPDRTEKIIDMKVRYGHKKARLRGPFLRDASSQFSFNSRTGGMQNIRIVIPR